MFRPILGRDVLDTDAVSAMGEGIHTSSRRPLFVLEDGPMLIDSSYVERSKKEWEFGPSVKDG